MEGMSGIEARWLSGVKPYFVRLIKAAEDPNISDADFLKACEIAHGQMATLLPNINIEALAASMEAYMGSAAVNGAVKGFLNRPVKQKEAA